MTEQERRRAQIIDYELKAGATGRHLSALRDLPADDLPRRRSKVPAALMWMAIGALAAWIVFEAIERFGKAAQAAVIG